MIKESLVGPGNKVQMDLEDSHLGKVSFGSARQGKLRNLLKIVSVSLILRQG